MLPSKNIFFGLQVLFFLSLRAAARKWRDTGGGIILEEAWTIPELLFQISNTTIAIGGTVDELKANLLDIHNQRLGFMDANDIDFMVISCASPCIQGLSDSVAAAAMAVTVNNKLASTIANNTERFGGFAALSMHNATEAALELQRAVKELGFFGALLNDYQQSGSDGNTLLYYDQPEYDVFWQMVTDLNVPIYFHPRVEIPEIAALEYQHAPFLTGSSQEFAITLSTHILGLCTNGIFDRFPNLNIVVGHLGERIPSDLLRIDAQLLRQIPQDLPPMKKNVTTYFHTNIYETTAGNFATELLKFHINQIGLDRIMYSIDYPWELMSDGATWINSLSSVLTKQNLDSLRREVAIKILRLDE